MLATVNPVTMQALPTTRPAEWQPVYVPKLKYRNAAPVADTQPSTLESNGGSGGRDPGVARGSGPTIREIRESLPDRSASRTDLARSSATFASPPPPQKKKKLSLLGGLFTKEPTIVALAQVQAQLVEQHGAANPQHVPHVSSRRMPTHVPKVNSKWDGVPDSVKAKEKSDQDKSQASKRAPLVLRTSHSMSSGPSDLSTSQTHSTSCRGSETESQDGSWDSTSSVDNRALTKRAKKAGSISSGRSTGSKNTASTRPPSAWSQSLRSPSGASLPEITAFFPDDIQPPPQPPSRLHNGTSAHVQPVSSSAPVPAAQDGPQAHISRVGTSTEHGPASAAGFVSRSPANPEVEPQPADVDLETVSGRRTLSSASRAVAHAEFASRKQSGDLLPGFLAGEARPVAFPDDEEDNLQAGFASGTTSEGIPVLRSPATARPQHDVAKRPDSSRARLKLQASLVVRAEAAPWEAQGPPFSPVSPTRSSFTTFDSPRTSITRSLGRRGK